MIQKWSKKLSKNDPEIIQKIIKNDPNFYQKKCHFPQIWRNSGRFSINTAPSFFPANFRAFWAEFGRNFPLNSLQKKKAWARAIELDWKAPRHIFFLRSKCRQNRLVLPCFVLFLPCFVFFLPCFVLFCLVLSCFVLFLSCFVKNVVKIWC